MTSSSTSLAKGECLDLCDNMVTLKEFEVFKECRVFDNFQRAVRDRARSSALRVSTARCYKTTPTIAASAIVYIYTTMRALHLRILAGTNLKFIVTQHG